MRDNYLSVNFIIYAMNKRRAWKCAILSLIPTAILLLVSLYTYIVERNYFDPYFYLLFILFTAVFFIPSIFVVCYTLKPSKSKPISEVMKVLLKEHPELIVLDKFLASMAMMSFTYSLGTIIISGGNMCPWGFVPLWLYYKTLFVLLLFYLYGFAGTVISAHYARVLVNDRLASLWGIFMLVSFIIFLIALMDVSAEIGNYEDAFRYGGAAALSLFIFFIGMAVATSYLSLKIKKIKRAVASQTSQSTSSRG